MLQKLSLNDLTCVSGGQIYAFFDKEKEIYHYLVPSTAGYATYHNKTEALENLSPFAKKGIVSCWTLDDAKDFAKTDSFIYRVLETLNNGGKA